MLSLFGLILMMQGSQTLVVPPSAPPLQVSTVQRVIDGRNLAVQNCQSCHSIGRTGTSPNAKAPQFRFLARRYPIDSLSEAFVEGAFVGHSVMPEFNFRPEQVDGLVSYIESIQVRPATSKRNSPKRTSTKRNRPTPH